MKKFNVKGILLVGESIEDHDHKEVLDIVIEGKTAQDVKENLLKNFSIEIQEMDKDGQIVPIMDCKTPQEEIENYDFIVLSRINES